MKAKKIFYIAIALWALTFTACRREEIYEGPCEVSFTTSMQRELTVSRGYVPFPNDYEPFTSALIIADERLNNISPMEYSNGQFTTKVRLEAGSYSVYGFMPWSDEGSFNSKDCVMTVPGIPTISQHDVMLIKQQDLRIYQDDETKTVDLQMDHMMARVTPHFYLHDKYAALRTIKIKQVDFIHAEAPHYTAVVTYNNDDSYRVDWNTTGTATADTMAVAYGVETHDTLTTTKGAQAYGTFYLCPAKPTAGLKMRVTYDVYDKVDDTKPIRENVVVENKIKQLPAMLEAGTNYKLNIKVTPTYLYSLSDNDEQTLLIVDVD